MIYVSLLGIAGRLICSYLSDAIGRRASGMLIGFSRGGHHGAGGIFLRRIHRHGVGVLPAGHDTAILRRWELRDHRPLHGRSLAVAASRERHGSRLWRRQSRQDLGPLGLALIIGSSNYVSPKATLDAIFPALLYPGVLVHVRGVRLLAAGYRDQGPLD